MEVGVVGLVGVGGGLGPPALSAQTVSERMNTTCSELDESTLAKDIKLFQTVNGEISISAAWIFVGTLNI